MKSVPWAKQVTLSKQRESVIYGAAHQGYTLKASFLMWTHWLWDSSWAHLELLMSCGGPSLFRNPTDPTKAFIQWASDSQSWPSLPGEGGGTFLQSELQRSRASALSLLKLSCWIVTPHPAKIQPPSPLWKYAKKFPGWVEIECNSQWGAPLGPQDSFTPPQEKAHPEPGSNMLTWAPIAYSWRKSQDPNFYKLLKFGNSSHSILNKYY